MKYIHSTCRVTIMQTHPQGTMHANNNIGTHTHTSISHVFQHLVRGRLYSLVVCVIDGSFAALHVKPHSNQLHDHTLIYLHPHLLLLRLWCHNRQGLIQDFLLGGGETVFLKKFWIFSESRTAEFRYNNFSNSIFIGYRPV